MPTKVIIFAVAISALILGGTVMVFGLTAYYNSISNDAQTAAPPPPKDPHLLLPIAETKENSDKEEEQQQQQLTGKLSLYILPLDYGVRYQSSEIVSRIGNSLLPKITAAYYTTSGASPQGSHTFESVTLTEQNTAANLKADGL